MEKGRQFAELAQSKAANERKEQYDADKRPHGIADGDQVCMWVARDNKLQQAAIGPMTVKRFLDPETKRTAVVHPPNQPEETAVVHVDRLIKAQQRPIDLVQISPDLSDWIEKQQDKDVPQAERDGPPQVSRAQRNAKDKEGR